MARGLLATALAVPLSCLAACSSPADSTKVTGSGGYVREYQNTIAHFPEALPSGVAFPDQPPPMKGQIEAGNGEGMAYFFWNCAWMDVYLGQTDTKVRARAVDALRAFPDTPWALKHYEDPDGEWLTVVEKAELGDLTDLRAYYETDCAYYRSVTGK